MRTAEAFQLPPSAIGGVDVSTKPTSWRLGELLSSADILLDVQAATKREAIGHLAELLAVPAGACRDNVLAALLRRERLGPTYIGDGIAMPHARVRGSLVPAAAVLRLRRPVDYGTAEDDEAHLLVGITWPDAETAGFVPTLATWRQLRTAAAAEALRRARTPTELHLAIARTDDRSLACRPSASSPAFSGRAPSRASDPRPRSGRAPAVGQHGSGLDGGHGIPPSTSNRTLAAR